MLHKTITGCILFLLMVSGCAEKRWVCYVDKNADSKCIKGYCGKMTESGFFKENCKKGYRVMKIFPTKEAFVYSVNPLTDIQACKKHGDEGEQK